MQWNIQKGLGTLAKNTNVEAKAIARIINYQQPDVILFNELQSANVASNTAALVAWVTNNVPYLGTQPGVSFYVAVSSISDGFNRNAAISRYPIVGATTYDDGLRGLHSFDVQLIGTNRLHIFHTHLKCCADVCSNKQNEAQFDANTMTAWAATNATPYVYGGDLNEDELNPECPLSATYHPITTVREAGGLVEYLPTTLDGEYRTWSTAGTPSIRFDYLLPASNRLAAAWGFVFSTMNWAKYGQYTNASPQNLTNDSRIASDHYPVVVAYDFAVNPATLTVSPLDGLTSQGNVGGPFSPTTQTYTLANTGDATLNWAAANASTWVTLSSSSGLLVPGASVTLTVSVNTAANNLSVGSYVDVVTITNLTAGIGSTTRMVGLTVNELPGALTVTPAGGLTSSGNQGGPFTPASQTYTLANTGGQTISWTATNGQTWDSLSATAGTLAPGASTTVTVSLNANTLVPGTYADSVSFANTSNGNGSANRPVSITVNATIPNAPTGLVVTAISKSQINLTWKDNSSNETGFKIERSTNGSTFTQIATVGTNATSYSNTGLTANTLYYYRVRAYNAAGNSAYSNTASTKTKRK